MCQACPSLSACPSPVCSTAGPQTPQVNIYLMEDYNVVQLKPSTLMEVPGGHTLTDQFRIIAHADMVAVVHPQCGDFRVPRMMPDTFFARGHRAGAAVRF